MHTLLRTCPFLFSFLFCLALLPLAAAEEGPSEVDRLIAEIAESIPSDVLAEPGSVAFPEKVAELVAMADQLGLGPAEGRDLRIRLGEAWLASDRGGRAAEVFTALAADAAVTPAQVHRIGLGLVRAWELQWRAADTEEEREALGGPVEYLEKSATFDPRVRARAWCVLGQLRSEAGKASAPGESAYMRALELVKEETVRERVPIYALIVAAMEKAEVDPQEIERWLKNRREDKAAQQVLETLLTNAQKLVGRKAPPLSAPRLDGEAGRVAVADYADRDRPVLIYFFASWCEPCHIISPVVAKLAATEDIAVLGVSLDNLDSEATLPDYLAKNGITFPVIGEKLGWDGEVDDDYHVEAIPHLVLVDADGIVADADMVDIAGGDATAARVKRALEKLAEAAAGEEAAAEGPVIP